MSPLPLPQVTTQVHSSNSPKLLGFFLVVVLQCSASTARADYEAGVNAAFAGDFETAFKEFSIAAEEGLDLAQYNLGILYFTGQGVEQNFEAAFKWTESAARQGHLGAQFNLATLYYDGQGTPEDRDTAITWFTQAGKAGNPDAAFVLAKMYENGEHVAKDLVLAHAWASMAASYQHAGASNLLLTLERDMDAEELSQARRQFAVWQIE